MASFVINGVDDLIHDIESLYNADEIAIKAVNEAAEIMDTELKKEIKSATHKYGTGQLAASIHHVKPKKNDLGIFTASTARGRDDKGVRNHDKLYYLEYGTTRQNPAPVVARAVNKAEKAVLEKLQEVFDRETKL